MTRKTVHTCEAAAFVYRRHGWSEIPLRSGEKTPKLPWHGVDPEVALELLLSWNRVRCELALDDEVARVVASITKLHRRADQGEAE